MICRANQLTGFYMMATFAFDELRKARESCDIFITWLSSFWFFILNASDSTITDISVKKN